jgi:excisionase family DNA binding protein
MNDTNPYYTDSLPSELITHLLGAIQEMRDAIFDIRERVSGASKTHYTVEEVAADVGRAPFTVRRWIKDGRLRADRVTGTGPRGRLLIPREEFQKLILSGKGTNIPTLLIQKSNK